MKVLFKNIGWLLLCCGLQANQPLSDNHWDYYESFLKKHRLQRLSYKGDTVTQLKIRYFVPAVLKQWTIPAAYRKKQSSDEWVLVRPEYTVMADELFELTRDLRTGVWTGLLYDGDTSKLPHAVKPASGWQSFEKSLMALNLETIPYKTNDKERWFVTAPDCGGVAYCEWSDPKCYFPKIFHSDDCKILKDEWGTTPSTAQIALMNQSNAVYHFFEKEL